MCAISRAARLTACRRRWDDRVMVEVQRGDAKVDVPCNVESMQQ